MEANSNNNNNNNNRNNGQSSKDDDEKLVRADDSCHIIAKNKDGQVIASGNDIKNDDEDVDVDVDDATFFKLFQTNRPYRLYLLACIISQTGEWLTYMAAITVIESSMENILGTDDDGANSSSSMPRTAVGVLVVVRMIPSILLMSAGGTLADSQDRRVSMIYLDVAAAAVVALMMIAFDMKSIAGIYLVTFFQECIGTLHEPCRSSIIPLLVPQENYLQKATTLSDLASFLVTAIGSIMGGYAVTFIGVRGCVVLDSLTYLVGAYLMWLVGGTWNVATESEATVNTAPSNNKSTNNNNSLQNVINQMISKTVDGARYLFTSSFGALVLVKASSGFLYGATYLLNVSFSELGKDGDDSHHSSSSSSERLGILFGFVGIGCIVGTLVGDNLTDMSDPTTLQLACVLSLAIQTLGVLGMGLFTPFWIICLMTLVESSGVSVLWINSSLLLQKFCTPAMLGRVVAVEFLLFSATEAISAMLCGILQDKAHLSPNTTSLVFAAIGSFLVLVWTRYHYVTISITSHHHHHHHHHEVFERKPHVDEYTKLERSNSKNGPPASSIAADSGSRIKVVYAERKKRE